MTQSRRTYLQWALDNCPPWLLGEWGTKLITVIGQTLDDAYTEAFEAGAAGSVDAPTFPADALPLLGSERNIERYPAETDDEYKGRVKAAWDSWQQAGTMRIVEELEYLGFEAEIKEVHTAGWDWDGDTDNWSRFWVVITGHPWSESVIGEVGRKFGEGVIGCDATQAEAGTLIRLIRKWKPGHMFPITVVVLDESTWDSEQPDGTWGDAANRSASAIYHYDR